MRGMRQAVLPVMAFCLLAWGLARIVSPQGAPSPGSKGAVAAGTNGNWGANYSTNAAGTILKSPIAEFRELLAMNAADREKALAEKSERYQSWFQDKQVEYANLTATERELRLRTTELRWYLLPLMRGTLEKRQEWMASVPAIYHKLVEARMSQWDKLSPERQKEVLENELTISYFGRLEGSSRAQQAAILARMSQGRREKLEQDLKEFRLLSADKRERMQGQFSEFFELNDKEKSRILGELPSGERRQITKDLKEFENLPAEQRVACLKSFEKFASMTPEQQMVFMKNAELWKELSHAERQLWRNLVTELPPSPPGLGDPPLPPDFGIPNPEQMAPRITKQR